LAADGTWGHDGNDGLSFPTRLSVPRGESIVQIQRMVHPGRYGDAYPSPESKAYDIAGGERSVLAQYFQAIGAARRSIYIENQAIPIPEVAAALEIALRRGVDVVTLVPADPEEYVRLARQNPGRRALCSMVWPRLADMRTSLWSGLQVWARRVVAATFTFIARSC
jgi:cardiolipin synthase A/B